MKIIIVLFLVIFSFVSVFSQTVSDLQKLVETEKSFARIAAEKGTRSAFLTFLADDGIVFSPEATNGKEMWKARSESLDLLSWQPTFADISANSIWVARPAIGNFVRTAEPSRQPLWSICFDLAKASG